MMASGASSPAVTASTMSPLARVVAAGANKSSLKEKVVNMYEALLRGEDPEKSSFGEHFWSEFFLLRPKVIVLEAELAKLTSPEQFVAARANLNRLFEECVANLSEEHHIRVVYALQTLCALLRASTARRGQGQGQATGYDLINMLMGFDVAEHRMNMLIGHINEFLTGEEPACLKELCLKLLVIMATGFDNVSQNTLLEYVMMNSVFESVIHLLSNAECRLLHGHSAVLLLTILVQYRKYESSNPYVAKLSILDQELALHGYGQVITTSLVSYTQAYQASFTDQSSSGWFSSITSMVGNMFVSDEGSPRIEQMKARNSILLALYEAVHLNRNFIATLTHCQVPSPHPGPRASVGHGQFSSLATTEQDLALADHNSLGAVTSNLLVAFLEYCSIVMQDTKSDSSQNTVKLSFLILLCVTEDQYANALMHDQNLVFRVRLHRAPMRHRKINAGADFTAHSRPLACAVLDLMVEFIRSHMMKRLPHELFSLALFVVHRLLAYQKRSRVRITYPWKELWTALIALIKFIISNESTLIKKMNIFAIAYQVVIIFNLFVTYGDTFLPSPTSYDELYYEMVRCNQTFDSLYAMALRYSTSGGEYKEWAGRLTNYLVNIRAITAHFSPKIEAWLQSQQLSTPTEEQILEVVKSNYDSLTLKLQDGLDQYDHYVESPRHSAFFTALMRNVVSDTRQHMVLNDLELQTVLQDFSTIQ